MSFVDFSACISLYFSWLKVNDIRILLHTVFVSMGHLWNNDMSDEDATRSIPSVSFLFKVVPTYSVCFVCLKIPVVRWQFEDWNLKRKRESTIVYLCSSQGAGKTLQVIICLVKGLLGERQIWPLTVSYTRPLTKKVEQCEKTRAERILLFVKPLFVCRCCRLGVAVMVTKVFYGHF